jgi:SOS-response transcriptional repressor LexA
MAYYPIIPLQPADATRGSACDGGESFALMVLGDAMLPEFAEGEVIVVEPGGLTGDGSFVLACVESEWMLRQLVGREGGWALRALDPSFAEVAIADLSSIRGVVIQKSVPGRRRAAKRYAA